MANLGILNGAEFYRYDVDVFDNVLLGKLALKDSQIKRLKSKGFYVENKPFYGINRIDLVLQFIKYLESFGEKVDYDSFLLNDVFDKRVDKTQFYTNDVSIFSASPKQYNAQASVNNSKHTSKAKEESKEVLKLDMEFKDKIFKTKLNLDSLGIGTGIKTFYDFNEKMLKNKIESFLKSFKKSYDIQLSLKDEFIQVGKLLIDVTLYNDYIEGFVDLTSLKLNNLKFIKVTGKNKQNLLDNIIQQLKNHKLTGKLGWGKIVDKTKNTDHLTVKDEVMQDNKPIVKSNQYIVKKGDIAAKIVPFVVGQIYKVVTTIPSNIVGVPDIIDEHQIQVLSILKSGKIKCKNLTLGYEFKIIPEPATKHKVYTLIKDVVKTDNKSVKEPKKGVVKELTLAKLKTLHSKIVKMVKQVGFNEQEIRDRILDIVPEAELIGVEAGGERVDLNYKFPFNVSDSIVKKKVFADEVDALEKHIEYLEKDLLLYIVDDGGEDEIGITFIIDIHYENTFSGEEGWHGVSILEDYVKIDDNQKKENILKGDVEVSSSVLREFVEKIASRKEVKLSVKIDKDTPHPVSFYVKEKGFRDFSVNFENNATKFRATLVLDAPFIELQDKTMKLYDFLFKKGFNVTQEGIGVIVRGSYGPGDLDIINDLVKLLDSVKPSESYLTVQDLVKAELSKEVAPPKNEVEPPNREVERGYKAGKVKDPEHKAQLDRMKSYIKKIADVVDADNDFALRFLEEPKEFQKYKLPTVGVGLFYYGDKTPAELEQNALYKKVYRGRGLSILRKFFKTTDLNGEKCLLVLFVDGQYAKESKAKLIKECLETGNKVKINGRFYTVKSIHENKFAIETIAGLMYIDMDSNLIDITVGED